MLCRLCVHGMEIGIAKHFLEKGRGNLSFKTTFRECLAVMGRGGKNKSLHASNFPGISHMPVEVQSAVRECEGWVSTFLAVGASSLSRNALTKPPCLQRGGGVVWSDSSLYNQD